ncbi:LOW QUALITY PROTEIN: cyclin-H-like [Amphiura filiformis]|uniref:LOW QUALITY PROTEIN: cyclin-H-like n=1 Tax=Amphiura filiformis TaxID=82378 RepID=UPI003B2125F2
MFHTSSQKKFWTFSDEDEIETLRKEINQKFVEEHGAEAKGKDPANYFLTAEEERLLCRQYEHLLRDFCRKFEPPMPPAVQGTSCTYLKRFYLNNSTMDYHPKYIMLTCVYLACKVEEFNVSIMQFCGNLPKDQEKAAELILGHELLVMQQLNFQLTIHNSFRPLEGLLIDIKTRYPSLSEPEQLRRAAEEFLFRSLASDACLLFAPSQISLAAIVTSARKQGLNIDEYVTETLLGDRQKEDLPVIIETIKRIRTIVKNVQPLNGAQVKQIERKLEKCRNQELNPESEVYKKKAQRQIDLEEEEITIKHQHHADERRKREEEILMSV